jgi:ribosomal protein S21
MIVNAEVPLAPGMDATAAWRRLHKLMMKNGTYTAMKRHTSYRKPSQAARIKSAKARRRARKDGYLSEARRLAYLDRQGLSDDAGRAAQSR